MNDKTMPSYLEQIALFKPKYLYGYPSAVDLLAEYVLRNNQQSQSPQYCRGSSDIGGRIARPTTANRRSISDYGLFLLRA